MPTLVFPRPDSLRSALAGGGPVLAVAQTRAEAGWDRDGRLWLTPTTPPPREAVITLQRFGVRLAGANPALSTRTVCCWHELLDLVKSPAQPSPNQSVLYDVPGGRFASLGAEIERCGGRIKGYCWIDDLTRDDGSTRVLIQVERSPYFTLLRAESAIDSSIHAYVEQSPGVWTAIGWTHPLAHQIPVPAGTMLLLAPPRTWTWRDAAFQTNDSARQPLPRPNPHRANVVEAKPVGLSVPVRLRLIPVADDAPAELWIIREAAFPWLENFLRNSDEAFLQRFTCAVAESDGKPVLVLRTRGNGPPPILVEAPLGFRPLMKLANLYQPCGFTLTPLPRRDSLRQLLAANTRRLTWLSPREQGAFVAESAALDGFRPLLEVVEYRAELPRRLLSSWSQQRLWEFARFTEKPTAILTPRKPAAAAPPAPPTPAVEEKKRSTAGWLRRLADKLLPFKRRNESPAPPPTPAETEVSIEDAVRTALPMPREPVQSLRIDEARERVRTLTARFHELLDGSLPGSRADLWPELAAALAAAGQSSDAALGWLNALWQQEHPSSLWAWGWLKAEAAQAMWNPHDADLDRWLSTPADKFRPRAVAAYALWATLQDPLPETLSRNLARLHAYLDANEHELPIRGAWMVRLALVRSTQGDVLALARTRDRLLERLRSQGLSLGKDVPSFIRAAGADDPDRFERVGKWLTRRRDLIQQWIDSAAPPRSDTGQLVLPHLHELEAEIRCTKAYADLLVAWGLSRLGDETEADRLCHTAWESLPDADPIHRTLKALFQHRLYEARENRSAGPLPPALESRLAALAADDRYRVDRFRQRSRILEPFERVDVWWASIMRPYRGWDDLRRQLVDLPGLPSDELHRRIDILLNLSVSKAAASQPLILLAVLALAPRLDAVQAERALHQAMELVPGRSTQYLPLLERALDVAAFFERETDVRLLANRFVEYVEDQRGRSPPTLLEGLTAQTFRSMRKFGMKREADEVLPKIHHWLIGNDSIERLQATHRNDWPAVMRTLLPVAAAYYYCGRSSLGFQIIDPISKVLYDAEMTPADRTTLARAYAAALGQVPAMVALGRFDHLFQRLRGIDVKGWNTHFTLQPLEIIDTVVRAVVSEDFALEPAIRGWLDDDEFHVRQRIHRDMKAWLNEGA